MDEKLRVADVESALGTFLEYGAVIIQTDIKEAILNNMERHFDDFSFRHERGPGRWCVNNAENFALEGYQAIVNDIPIATCVSASTESTGADGQDWSFGPRPGGDGVDKNTDDFQGLHNDWGAYPLKRMYWGYPLVVSVAPYDIGYDFAPLRLVPWSDEYPALGSHRDQQLSSDDYKVRMYEGEALIRDCRVSHGGTPNLTDRQRFLPGVQILSPQYRADLAKGC